MRKLFHHTLRAFVALVLVCVSLPVMYDVFVQKEGNASETFATRERLSSSDLSSLAIVKPEQAGPVSKDAQSDDRQKDVENVLDAANDDPQSGLDAMLAEIDSILADIDTIATSNLEPAADAPNRPRAAKLEKDTSRLTPAEDVTISAKLNDRMAEIVREKAKKTAERPPEAQREIVRKMLDKLEVDGSGDIGPPKTEKKSEETLVLSKSAERIPPSTVPVASPNEHLNKALQIIAKQREGGGDEATALSKQLQDLRSDIEKTTQRAP
ncbi:MAG: hypothetical protein AAFW47_06470, partial [Pseudomonadota bacterium]